MLPGEVFSLYRSYLREVNRVSQVYVRFFYQIKARDDIKALLATDEHYRAQGLRERKAKRIKKDLHRLHQANIGKQEGMMHVLNNAYGRRGKLRHELIEPYLTDPTVPLPDPIIPGVERSRPPVLSPELRALLLSGISRAKPLRPSSLLNPPKSPDRSTSVDALNPPNKRRETNSRQRFFKEACQKTLPPLGSQTGWPSSLLHHGVLDDIHQLVGPVTRQPALTRKEKEKLVAEGKSVPSMTSNRYPSRWMRRRYQEVLATIPILKPLTGSGKRYEVVNSDSSLVKHDRTAVRLVDVNEATLAWCDLPRPK